MECDVCCRGHDPKRLPFLCAVDARNQIYEGRIKNLQLFMENEALQRQVNDLASKTSKPNLDTMDSAHAQQRAAEDKTLRIIAAADRLRDDIKTARDEIQAKKKAIALRKTNFAALSKGVVDRRTKESKDVDKTIHVINYRWSQCAEEAARTRSFLCQEAAGLYGLERVMSANAGRDEYHIGKLPIVDLTSMNAHTPETISTSLGHISHILVLASYYLSIRLPAEITLPHRDYPRTTIFNLLSSYHHGDVAFPSAPGVTPSSSEARVTDSQHVPRPRPLFIDKPLPQLFKEDQTTYNFFLEGVTLLAYDVAWLCSSQGVPVGDSASFENICNIGRNLHNLLVSQPSRGLGRSSTDAPTRTAQKSEPEPTLMGRFSHGSKYYDLAGAEGTELIRSFGLPSTTKLRDMLKNKLLSDAPAADWEVLEHEAWKVDEEPDNGVLVENPRHKSDRAMAAAAKGSPRSGEGWMRVKNR